MEHISRRGLLGLAALTIPSLVISGAAQAKSLDYSALDGMDLSQLQDLDGEVRARIASLSSSADSEGKDASGSSDGKSSSSTSDSAAVVDFQSMTAEQVVQQFIVDGFPIGQYVVYDEETDENGILGRPGQYTSKVNFNITSLDFDEEFDVGSGGSVEVFSNDDDCQARTDYLLALNSVFPEYDYNYGHVLLRLSSKLLPADAATYQQELLSGGSTTPPASDDGSSEEPIQQLQVIEQSWAFSNEGWGYWPAVGFNPNNYHVCKFPTFVVTAYGENGSILNSQEQVVGEVWPQSRIAYSGQIDTGGIAPTSIEVTMKHADDKTWESTTSSQAPTFPIANISEVDTAGIGTTFNGVVGNGTQKTVTLLVTVLMRDETGKLVDGASGLVNSVPAGGSSPFSIDCYSGALPHSSFDVIAELI